MTNAQLEAKVSTYPRVAQIMEDGFQLVITVGSEHGVSVGDKFLVYAEGIDIIDPVTRENLGKLDKIRGRGVVSLVYPKFCVIDSLERTSNNPRRRVVDSIAAFSIKASGDLMYGPFNSPQVGDFARPV